MAAIHCASRVGELLGVGGSREGWLYGLDVRTSIVAPGRPAVQPFGGAAGDGGAQAAQIRRFAGGASEWMALRR